MTDLPDDEKQIREHAAWVGKWRAYLEIFIQNQVDTVAMLDSMQSSISELDSYESKLRRYVKAKDIAVVFDQPERHLSDAINYLAKNHDTWLSARAKAEEDNTGESADDEKFEELNNYLEQLRNFIKVQSGQDQVSFLQVLSLERLNRKVPGRDYSRRITEASLTMLVAETELFASRLVRKFIEAKPGILIADEIKLGWREIQNYENVAELQDLLVSRKTDEIAAKSFDDFNYWFAKQVGEIEVDESILNLVNDATQLRHLIIHSGSRITERALGQLRGSRYSKRMLGKRIPLTSSDLATFASAQITYSLILWILLVSKLAKSNAGRSEHVFGSISQIQVLLLEKNLPEPIILTRDLVSRQAKSEMDADIAFVNHCLAKGQIGDSSYLVEVSEWDCHAKSEIIQLVKVVLEGNLTAAAQRAEDLIASGVLPKRNLYEWPVFAPLRSL